MKKIVATSQTCGPCFALKKKIERENLNVEIINMEDDIEFFRKYNIKSVPRLVVIQDDDSFELIQGSDDIIAKLKEKTS